ncbi:ecdysteroid UDP-glucosyltransferase [Spodoptera exempta nucleopolyhedrovirus]|uniref:Ecdysteroid UDP-glucosyltransferase n=1 Tax=Spodoptera exempta nucleopolyhedrovirus TaxID=1242863 RepID=A0A410S7K5_9ABAC|nr:ecdysteroid UDP-glucosyltransferase [Spodoptera exempta nucleopolyhedrovirus]QAT90307.1 ecdysteroid UDP-glucosyltransferase [Spodoptera exempta nucleopolyhedrovirus]
MDGRVLILLLSIFIAPAITARILAVFPTPAYSHHSVFKTYIRALAKRGHDITVIKSTNKINYNELDDRSNITEIDASLSQSYFKKLMTQASVFRKRGLVADSSTVTANNYVGMVRMISDQFNLPNVKRFLREKQKFDIVITEAFMDYPLVFSHLFGDIPVIQISSGYAVAENFETMGAVSRHPVYYPNLWRSRFNKLNIWETINEIYEEIRLQNEFEKLAEEQNKMLKLQFGADTPTVQQLRNRVQILFVNTHAVFDNNRPVPPSVQYLGALHLTDRKPEPVFGVVGEILSSSTAAIYVSFGSGISTEELEPEFIEMMLSTFEALPYTVLWKYDGHLSRLPENVFVQSWFDQYNLLHHANLKAFVTQGGVQSTDEAIDALVPLLGMPMMGDQAFNTNKYTELGIGRFVDTVSVTKQELIEAIIDVVENPTYRKQLQKLRHLIRNQIVSPLDKAVWYTEHVINSTSTTGGSLMKTRAANVNYSDYFMSYIFVPLASFTVMNHMRQILRINLM